MLSSVIGGGLQILRVSSPYLGLDGFCFPPPSFPPHSLETQIRCLTCDLAMWQRVQGETKREVKAKDPVSPPCETLTM